MREEGMVLALDGDTARVRIARRGACDGCRVCAAIGPGGMVIEALNSAGAKVGDRVRVEAAGPDPLRAALLVYGLPLALLVAGCLGGTALTGSQTAGMGVGFAAFLLAYGALHRYDRRMRKTGACAATVVERITDGGKSADGICG